MDPHLHIPKGTSFERALVCGAPERAEKLARKLEGGKLVARNREYHSYAGKYRDKEILIASHGVGSAGAAICFQELIGYGVKAIVRVGTAGGLYDGTTIGDIVVATGAVRKDGVSAQMVPLAYPAVPDMELTSSLIANLKQAKASFRTGIVVTSDLFYPGLLPTELDLYRDANAVAVEMEASTLFVIGALKGVRTAAVVSLDGNPLKWEEGHYDPKSPDLAKSIELCADAALDALVGI